MTAATVPGIDATPTENDRLLTWVREVADLTMPDRVVWCDGSADEWDRMTSAPVEAGTFVKLNEEKKPNSFWAASDPTTSPASRNAPSSAPSTRTTPGPPTTGSIPPR